MGNIIDLSVASFGQKVNALKGHLDTIQEVP